MSKVTLKLLEVFDKLNPENQAKTLNKIRDAYELQELHKKHSPQEAGQEGPIAPRTQKNTRRYL